MTKDELLIKIGELIYKFEEERDNYPLGVYIDFGVIDDTPECTIYEWSRSNWKVSSGVQIKFVIPDHFPIKS